MLDPQRLPEIQQAIADAGADAWLFFCFQLNDPVSLDLLGVGGRHLVTRRCYYLVPRSGQPKKLNHRLEPAMLAHLPGEQAYYLTWREHATALGELVSGVRKLVAQYSPDNQLPNVSRLDAGTAEFLRARGVELVSSAELVQRFAATWSAEHLAGHHRACKHLHEIVRAAFDRVFDKLRSGGEDDEYAVQQFIVEQFERVGLWGENEPIVGVNAHSADPHYQPGPESSSPIRRGDFLLIDLFAKEKAHGSVYADMVATVKEALGSSGVKVAAVATAFPSGRAAMDIKIADTQDAVEAGADEIDMVIDRGAFLSGRYLEVFEEIVQIREACGDAHLKVILETGELQTYDNVRRASWLAMLAGGHFIKTSTGKVQPAATLPVTLVMLEAIRDFFFATGRRIGMKPAGGIRTSKQALAYLVMVKETLGDDWLNPQMFRFGASTLVNDVLMQIARQVDGNYQGSDYFSLP